MSVACRRFVEFTHGFELFPDVHGLAMDLCGRVFGASEKQQTVDHCRETKVFFERRLYHCTVLRERAGSAEGHLAIRAQSGNRSAQFMGDIARKAGDASESVFQAVERLIESASQREELRRQPRSLDARIQSAGADLPQ